jgi:hypothetical protein
MKVFAQVCLKSTKNWLSVRGIIVNNLGRPDTISGKSLKVELKNDGGCEFNDIYCKNFCKCHNVPPSQQQLKKKWRWGFPEEILPVNSGICPCWERQRILACLPDRFQVSQFLESPASSDIGLRGKDSKEEFSQLVLGFLELVL